MEVKTSDFEMVTEIDQHPDLSWLGEFSSDARVGAINHRERSGSSRHYRYFNPADPDYAEEDYERMIAYNNGYWYMMRIAAAVDVLIPAGNYKITHRVETPGLWGVESDADDSYHNEIFEEECHTLKLMLESIGIDVIDNKNEETESE